MEHEVAIPHTLLSIVGVSEQLRTLVDRVRRLSHMNVRVLIQGETGTGKELIARALHHMGPRAAGGYVGINCAAVPGALFESQLFGHRKGSFTGASTDQQGYVAAAEHGTLFLDEIGEMPWPMQSKLLRFLEEGAYVRLGETEPRPSDIRLVSATNVQLRRELGRSFREDLFHRIAEYELHIPPLRERRDDIGPIASYLHDLKRDDLGAKTKGLSEDAVLKLCEHSWPGNIRELSNVITRGIVNSYEGIIQPEHLSFNGEQPLFASVDLRVPEGPRVEEPSEPPAWYSNGVLPVTAKYLSNLPGTRTQPTLERAVEEAKIPGAILSMGKRSFTMVLLTPESLIHVMDSDSPVYEPTIAQIGASPINDLSREPFMFTTVSMLSSHKGVHTGTSRLDELLLEGGQPVLGSRYPTIYAVRKRDLKDYISPRTQGNETIGILSATANHQYREFLAGNFPLRL